MTDQTTSGPAPLPPGLSGKTSPLVLLFGLLLLAAGITLLCMGLKDKSPGTGVQPDHLPKPPLTAPGTPGKSLRKPGKP
ncbi:MAG: hypothetical protein VX675_06500 [Planctomycetota bacterium]|nr:hypothetical protein [Planctomycetota bacterium]